MKTFFHSKLNLFLPLLFFVVGCNLNSEDEYKPQYVVEAYLIGDEVFPELYLTKTLPLFEEYTIQKAGINSAEVAIIEIKDQNVAIDTIQYEKDINTPGVYIPKDTLTLVKTQTWYKLQINIPDDNNHQIFAQTLVPGSFTSVSANADTVMFQGEEQFKVTYTPSYYPNRQSYYVMTVFAQDTTGPLTPFYARIVEDGEPTRTELQKNGSNILTEANFTTELDGNVSLSLPWFTIAFYGPHLITAHTIDDNLYDFERTRDVQFGGSTISPGEIYDIIDHVEGGTGVFGSMYKRTDSIFISRNPLIDLLYPTQSY